MAFRNICLIFCSLVPSLIFAQISFTKQTHLLSPEKHYSGVAIAVLDMNGDGRDDIVRMNQGYQISVEYQNGPGEAFRHQSVLNLQTDSQWGICVADVDNNGIPDILTGGYYDGIKIIRGNTDGTAFSVTSIDEPETFVQGVNFADINNDGWVDAFVCHDDAEARIFLNDSTGEMLYAPDIIDLNTWPPTDNSGNYGSVWSDVDNDGDLDFYIAKCRTGVSSSSDGRRINQLFLNNGDGTFLQDTANVAGLRIGAQSWTADFGDIDNDGDFDCFITNHDVTSQLLENDGSGHFTDITEMAGLRNAITGLPLQGVFRDFDNDGYVDLLVAGSDHYLFRNNGDKTFTYTEILDQVKMESFALGDLNHDGFQDIYAGYAEIYTEPSAIPDAMWFNDGNDNHFFGLNLRGVQSNRSAIGAKVFLYSALGTQVREVRSGESYGIMNSTQVHFGMGQLTQIDSVLIHWPSGRVDTLLAPEVDQYLTVEEGKCVIPPVVASPQGNTVFCSGDSVQIQVPGVYDAFKWTTGSVDAQIVVSAAGLYAVTVTTKEGCTAVSNVVMVVVDPVETPQITAIGDTVFCIGGAVELTSSPAAGYLWTTGDTTASIMVNTPGSYAVTAQGLCAQFSSTPVMVTVLDAPLPVPVPDTVAVGSVASLTATGDELIWYDSATGGTVLFTGNLFETPPLQTSTTYWVANNAIYDRSNQFAGMPSHLGSNFASPQTNGDIVFDCIAPFRLASVKVYTNIAGVRKIVLSNAFNIPIQSKEVDIPAGTTVLNLDMDIPQGTGLRLTTDISVNQQVLGSNGPQLRRSDQGVQYPYEVPDYLRITGSSFGNQRYYYFFNWEIDFPGKECLSDRVPVTVVVDSTLVKSVDLPGLASISVYPNPSNGAFQLVGEQFGGGPLQVSLFNANGQSVGVQAFDLPAGPLRQPIDFGPLPPGIYWLQMLANDGLIQKKMVVATR
ncbi:MAG: VCBS repeat-containing protein [Lewinellaceae bacterium]|nr:VCBS repeat-containing protein [Lewinellaceae bacterium]